MRLLVLGVNAPDEMTHLLLFERTAPVNINLIEDFFKFEVRILEGRVHLMHDVFDQLSCFHFIETARVVNVI